MNKPKIGQRVNCPADRGDKAYTGTVSWVSDYTEQNLNGTDYVWVEVKHPSGSKHLWPSNRLGVKL